MMSKAIENDFPFEEIDALAEKESFRKEVNRPIYHIHKWWAQRLGSVFRAIVLGTLLDEDKKIWDQFYLKHQFSNKIVLDPFMGSGTTLGEGLKLGCKTIGCDINPVSSFIVRQAFRKIDSQRLIEAFKKLESIIKPKIQYYYRKQHPVSQEICSVLYYFWVKIVTTPEGGEIPLFSNYVFSRNAYPLRQPGAKIICPACFSINDGRFDETRFSCKFCDNTFNPQEGNAKGQFVSDPQTGKKYKIVDLLSNNNGAPPQHKLYAALVLKPDGTKEYLPVDEHDLRLYDEACIKSRHLKSSFADMHIEPGYNTDQAIKYNYLNWKDFFNPRQYLCLSMLLEEILKIEDKDIRNLFVCLFSGTLEFNNMFCSFKGEGTGAVRHLFSHHVLKPEKTPLENCVWGTEKSSGTFSTLFRSRILKAEEYLAKPFEIQVIGGTSHKRFCNPPLQCNYVNSFEELSNTPGACLVLNGDSAQLPLPDQCVDAIVTDPPYFDFVHYSELADFFYAWLSPALKSELDFFGGKNSRSDQEVQNRDETVFSSNLSKVFEEGKRVLKDDGVMVFSFHHSKIKGWKAIYDAIVKAGFYIYEAYPVKAEMSVATPKNGSQSPINLDALIVCKKIEKLDPNNNHGLENLSLLKYRYYLERFARIGRELSIGDKKVIYISQLLCERSRQEAQNMTTSSIPDDRKLEQIISTIPVESFERKPIAAEKMLSLFD